MQFNEDTEDITKLYFIETKKGFICQFLYEYNCFIEILFEILKIKYKFI